MKCLEMIKHNLDLCEKSDTDYGFVYKSELEEIKFRLEVLEIINKKNVRIGEIKYYLKELKEGISISITKIEDVLIEYNKGVALEDELTLEELLKLKQWMEVNEK